MRCLVVHRWCLALAPIEHPGEVAFQVSRAVSCSRLPDGDVHYLVTVFLPFAPGWFDVDALYQETKVVLFPFGQLCRSMLERENCCQLDLGFARFWYQGFEAINHCFRPAGRSRKIGRMI